MTYKRVFRSLIIGSIFAMVFYASQNTAWAGNEMEFKGPATVTGDVLKQEDKIIEEKSAQLTNTQKKISSDLIQLIRPDFLPPGQTRENAVKEMQYQKQLKSFAGGSDNLSATSIDSSLAYVYITLEGNTDTSLVDSYASEVVSRDDKNHIVAAWIPLDRLEELATDPDVSRIQTVLAPVFHQGSVTSQGDSILNADKFRNITGKDGSGIKIGVISDGVDSWTKARNKGDLPSDLHILSNSLGGDEGTAVLEIIHDLAPGAELYFHDCGSNKIAFQSAVDDLLASGCNIICDDIGWIGEPYYEDGTVAQHINSVLASKNILYVTAAGNDALNHYQGTFYNDGSNHHDFSRGASSYKRLYARVDSGVAIQVVLQWNDPFVNSTNNYDLYLREVDTNQLIASSTDIQDTEHPGNPLEYVGVINNYTSAHDVAIDVVKKSGGTKNLELYVFDSPLYTNNRTSADSIFGHAAISGVITTGAVYSSSIRSYSSQGPVTLLNETREKPDICGVDGVKLSSASGLSPFYGTSAAAPHVAAIAALAWSVNPDQTAGQIKQGLLNSAVDLGSSGADNLYGYGMAYAIATGSSTEGKDLKAVKIDGPDSGSSGSTISVSDTVKNQGNLKTSTFYVKYYLSSDDTIDNTDVYLGQRKVSSLKPGKSSSKKTKLTIPASTPGGEYYLGAVADATDRVVEYDETNNSAYDDNLITISQPYKELLINSINGPDTGTIGKKISVNDTVKNQGTAKTPTFYVKYYLSTDNSISDSDICLGKRKVSSMKPGASSSKKTKLSIPKGTPAGEYYLGAIVDANSSVIESDETNNIGYDADPIDLS